MEITESFAKITIILLTVSQSRETSLFLQFFLFFFSQTPETKITSEPQRVKHQSHCSCVRVGGQFQILFFFFFFGKTRCTKWLFKGSWGQPCFITEVLLLLLLLLSNNQPWAQKQAWTLFQTLPPVLEVRLISNFVYQHFWKSTSEPKVGQGLVLI